MFRILQAEASHFRDTGRETAHPRFSCWIDPSFFPEIPPFTEAPSSFTEQTAETV